MAPGARRPRQRPAAGRRAAVDRYSEALRAQRPFGASFEIALRRTATSIARPARTRWARFSATSRSTATARRSRAPAFAARPEPIGGWPLGEATQPAGPRSAASADLYKTSKFNDIAADLARRPRIQPGPQPLQLELGATQRWFGQKPFIRSARVGGDVVASAGIADLAAAQRLGGADRQPDQRLAGWQELIRASCRVERALSADDWTSPQALELDRQSLKDPGYSTTGWRGGLTAWRDLGRMTLDPGCRARPVACRRSADAVPGAASRPLFALQRRRDVPAAAIRRLCAACALLDRAQPQQRRLLRLSPDADRDRRRPRLLSGAAVVAGVEGLEPTTLGFGDRCSTN